MPEPASGVFQPLFNAAAASAVCEGPGRPRPKSRPGHGRTPCLHVVAPQAQGAQNPSHSARTVLSGLPRRTLMPGRHPTPDMPQSKIV